MTENAEAPKIFDRQLLALRRTRAAANWVDYNFLFDEVADRLAERLGDVNRDFDHALDLGTRGGELFSRVSANTITKTDISTGFLGEQSDKSHVVDEEHLPFDEASFDLVTSNLNLHWVNDLPGALIQIRRSLKPDSLFLASLWGGDTLTELRDALMMAEMELEGGMSPRISPFADVKDMGSLLQRAGFAMPVADVDTITVSYDDAFKLMKDLRGMGESNLVATRRKTFTRRSTMLRAAEIYQEKHEGEDGRIPATFQVIYLTGWSPGPDQPKALKPGTAKTSLTEVFGKKGSE
jgi:SAM-dependent methyltransferase